MSTQEYSERWAPRLGAGFVRAPVVAIALLLAACSKNAPPANDQVFRELQAALPAPMPAQETARPVLYLDTSESMKGFVHGAARTSAFVQTVGAIYRTAAQTYSDYEMWGISSQKSKIEHFSDVENDETYHGGDTPLSGIFDEMSARVRQGRTSVFISDMVQSEGVQDVRDLSQAVMRLANSAPPKPREPVGDRVSGASRPSIKLLAFRSAFDGEYFVETVPKGKFWAKLSGEGEDARPFYLLVVAPSPAAMDDVNRTILRDVKPSQVFSPTEMPIQVERKWRLADGEPRTWDVYQRANWPSSPIDKFKLGDCSTPTCMLNLVFQVSEYFTVRSENDLASTVASAAFADGKPSEKMRSAPWQPRTHRIAAKVPGKGGGAGLSYRFELPIPRPSAGKWVAYHIQVAPGRGNLAFPEWVGKWSTADDHSSSVANRTLNLDAVVGTLIHEISEKTVFFDSIILAGR
jgi:hypothetical protein